jgi:hypothetical protein
MLVYLRLNSNFWQGSIPDVFEDYTKLDFFDISNNMMTGTVPQTIFLIPTIRFVYMSNCNLDGPIPSEFAFAPILRDLYLNGNMLTGTVPSIEPGQLEQLNEFLLQGNRLQGVMPESICNLRAEFILDDLWTDCGGQTPEIECDFPDCCNRCFEGQPTTLSR